MLTLTPQALEKTNKLSKWKQERIAEYLEQDLATKLSSKIATLSREPEVKQEEYRRAAQYVIWRVCKAWGVGPNALVSQRRVAEYALPRVMVAKIAVDLVGLPMGVVAEALKRDRTTLYGLVRRHDKAIVRYMEYIVNWGLATDNLLQEISALNYDGQEPVAGIE